MIDPLSPIEIRVLGALAEKSLATPEYYPMSLNGLVAACNQKTGRDPVMELSEGEAAAALDQLMRRRLAGTTTGAGSRVEKYRHLLDHAFELDHAEVAALAVLLLRGPQTAGEVRSRSNRLYEFETLSEVEATLHRLADREEPLATALPVQPGRKEPRFVQLLGGPIEIEDSSDLSAAPSDAMAGARARGDRLETLEARVDELHSEMAALRDDFARFKKQFE